MLSIAVPGRRSRAADQQRRRADRGSSWSAPTTPQSDAGQELVRTDPRRDPARGRHRGRPGRRPGRQRPRSDRRDRGAHALGHRRGPGAVVPAARGRPALDHPAAESHCDEPAVGRGRVRRRGRAVPVGLGRRPARLRSGGLHPGVRSAVPVLRPVRTVDGLRGLPDDPDAGGVGTHRRQRTGGHPRARADRPDRHLGGPDHGGRVRRVHRQPPARVQGDGIRACRRGAHRRDRGAGGRRARDDAPARPVELVDAPPGSTGSCRTWRHRRPPSTAAGRPPENRRCAHGPPRSRLVERQCGSWTNVSRS